MSPALLTRRALVRAAGATAAVGTMALTAVAEARFPVSDPDAVLLDLIARHGEADQALRAAEDEAERLLGVARAAYPEQPEALFHRPGDFPRTAHGLGLSTPVEDVEGEERREYQRRAADWLRARPASTWFRTLSPPLGAECEARRVEILEAFDAWTAEKDAVDDRMGWTAADEARAVAGRRYWDLDDAIREHEVRTLPVLRAKAAWIAERSDNGLDETEALLAFAREVAAFGRAT